MNLPFADILKGIGTLFEGLDDTLQNFFGRVGNNLGLRAKRGRGGRTRLNARFGESVGLRQEPAVKQGKTRDCKT